MNRLDFPLLAQRLFNTPLAITEGKAEVIMAALSARLGIGSIVRADGTPVAFFEIDDDDEDFGFSASGDRRDTGYDLLGPIARIQITGTLVQRCGSLRPYSGMTGYNGIRTNFLTAQDDPAVGAIMLEIDSPGGEVAGCFDLVDKIWEYRGEKPVWAILNENAYSAAYAIASAADRVIVPRTGGTGSIGVIMAHVDWSEALAKAGIKVTFIKRGLRKADGAPEQPLSQEAYDALQADIDVMGELFEETVARNRKIAASKVKGFEAGTFLGAAGVTAGLADDVMAPDAAFAALLDELRPTRSAANAA